MGGGSKLRVLSSYILAMLLLLQTGSKSRVKGLTKAVKATSLLGFERQKAQLRGSAAHEDPTPSSSTTCKAQGWKGLKAIKTFLLTSLMH